MRTIPDIKRSCSTTLPVKLAGSAIENPVKLPSHKYRNSRIATTKIMGMAKRQPSIYDETVKTILAKEIQNLNVKKSAMKKNYQSLRQKSQTLIKREQMRQTVHQTCKFGEKFDAFEMNNQTHYFSKSEKKKLCFMEFDEVCSRSTFHGFMKPSFDVWWLFDAFE